MGALFVTIFQIVYLFHDYDAVAPEAFYLHLTNIVIALSGFLSSLFPFGRIYGRVISFWGLSALMLSMMRICILTVNNDWFYVSLALLTMGASALMPWEIGWQSALNLVALLTALVQWRNVRDPNAVLHWLLVALALGITQTATTIAKATSARSRRRASTPSRRPKPSPNFSPVCRMRSARR